MSSGTIAQKEGGLNTPYGGSLVDLVIDEARAAEMKGTAKDVASLTLDERAGRWAGQAKTECGLHSLDSSQL